MIQQSILLKLSSPGLAESTTSQLRLEYQAYQNLFELQPVSIQQHLRAQAALLTKALVNRAVQITYRLPEAITLQTQGPEGQILPIPEQSRVQGIGSFINHLVRIDLQTELNAQLSQLEQSRELAVSTAALLLRHALVIHMVHDYLPEGKSVRYMAEEGDEIPCAPVNYSNDLHVPLIGTDPMNRAQDGNTAASKEKGGAYGSVAGGFFMPEWVVVDDQNRLVACNLQGAMVAFDAMRQYLSILEAAVGLASYIAVDEVFQSKHYGILGQLVNQGRALAIYQLELLYQTIQRRSASHTLDRGFSLSLPYFNDQTLTMDTYNFDVIPAGRVMFVPAFVVLAVRAEEAKVAQNTRLNQSTRKHLLKELSTLERAFLR